MPILGDMMSSWLKGTQKAAKMMGSTLANVVVAPPGLCVGSLSTFAGGGQPASMSQIANMCGMGGDDKPAPVKQAQEPCETGVNSYRVHESVLLEAVNELIKNKLVQSPFAKGKFIVNKWYYSGTHGSSSGVQVAIPLGVDSLVVFEETLKYELSFFSNNDGNYRVTRKNGAWDFALNEMIKELSELLKAHKDQEAADEAARIARFEALF